MRESLDNVKEAFKMFKTENITLANNVIDNYYKFLENNI